jgi:DNA modification methylase
MTEVDPSEIEALRTPKNVSRRGTGWYRYYAGFSGEFVNDVCQLFRLKTGQRVLDPWMGSGTTLSVAARLGCFVDGLDLNPVMSIVAKGRLLADDTRTSIDPLLGEIVKHWRSSDVLQDEMLTDWFTYDTSLLIRGLAQQIDKTLVLEEPDLYLKAQSMSSLAALFYVALFETVTSFLRAYGSRNPTWVKAEPDGRGVVALTRLEIENKYRETVKGKLAYLDKSGPVALFIRDMSRPAIGDSRLLPFETSSSDVVITSPPYLTRLDYVIGHRPELAVLGFSSVDVRALRRRMIGTPTINKGRIGNARLSPACDRLLRTLSNHDSYASTSYYEPIFRQYFEGMATSLDEIGRVCKPGSKVALVVQDSWFKDVHVDLAQTLTSIVIDRGWRYIGQKDFRNARSMAQLNSKAYPLARSTKPVESVLVLETSGDSSRAQ